MSTSTRIYLLVGLFVIYRLYKWAIKNNEIEGTIRIWSKPEHKYSPELRKAKFQKEAFKITASLSAVGYVLTVTNLVFNYLSGWYVLVILGIFYSYCYYLITGASYQYKSSFFNKNEEERLKAITQLEAVKKTSLTIFVVVLALSGYWAYQVQKNQSEQKLIAMNTAARLVGQGQCANFSSQKALLDFDGNYENINSGGWPCITVGSVTNVRFTNVKAKLEMCFSYSLRRSSGLPSESDNSTEYDYRSLCVDDGVGGWTEDRFLGVILKDLGKAVSELQLKMCQTYYYSLNDEEKYIYCSL